MKALHRFSFISLHVLCCAVLYCTVLYCTVLYCTVLYCTVLYCTVLYCTVLYCTVLYCTVLYCTVLYCTALHCIACHCSALVTHQHGIARRKGLVENHPPRLLQRRTHRLCQDQNTVNGCHSTDNWAVRMINPI